MKILSKINRGAILTSVIILGVIIYLVTLTIMQNNELPRIKQICDTYLQTHVKYSMLPAKYRVAEPNVTTNELSDYLKEMEKNIKAFYPANEQYSKFAIDNFKVNINNQSAGNDIIYIYTKDILTYDDIVFDKNTVDVKFTSKTTTESKSTIQGDSSPKTKLTQDTSDNIILQKIDNEWKVIYSSINRPNSGNPGDIVYDRFK